MSEALRVERAEKETLIKRNEEDREKCDARVQELKAKNEMLIKQTEELKFGGKIAEENALKEVLTLQDQKKLLVKEVKQGRKKTESLIEQLKQTAGEKENMEQKYSMSEQVNEELLEKLNSQDVKHAESINALTAMYEAKLTALRTEKESLELKMKWSSQGKAGDSVAFLDTSDYFKSSIDGEAVFGKEKDTEHEKKSSSLDSFDWLTEAQRSKIAQRKEGHDTSSGDGGAGTSGSGSISAAASSSASKLISSSSNMLKGVAKRSMTSISSLIPSRGNSR